MYVNFLGTKGTWREIANSARTTAGMEAGEGEPSSNWKRRMLLCEHSPIRQLNIKWIWIDLKYWVSVHFVRHWLGIIHWVKSQRPDRGINGNREDAPQSTLINHEAEANAQATINISRKRLCNCAMPDTREAWKAVLESFKNIEPELYSVCVRDCIYRGWCYEYKSCNWHKTKEFQEELSKYRNNINGYIKED